MNSPSNKNSRLCPAAAPAIYTCSYYLIANSSNTPYSTHTERKHFYFIIFMHKYIYIYINNSNINAICMEVCLCVCLYLLQCRTTHSLYVGIYKILDIQNEWKKKHGMASTKHTTKGRKNIGIWNMVDICIMLAFGPKAVKKFRKFAWKYFYILRV